MYNALGTAQIVCVCVGRQTCDEVAYCVMKSFCADMASQLVGRKEADCQNTALIVVTY